MDFDEKPMFKLKDRFKQLLIFYSNPIDPAVNPTAKKNVNSRRSLGRELTNKFN